MFFVYKTNEGIKYICTIDLDYVFDKLVSRSLERIL